MTCPNECQQIASVIYVLFDKTTNISVFYGIFLGAIQFVDKEYDTYGQA